MGQDYSCPVPLLPVPERYRRHLVLVLHRDAATSSPRQTRTRLDSRVRSKSPWRVHLRKSCNITITTRCSLNGIKAEDLAVAAATVRRCTLLSPILASAYTAPMRYDPIGSVTTSWRPARPIASSRAPGALGPASAACVPGVTPCPTGAARMCTETAGSPARSSKATRSPRAALARIAAPSEAQTASSDAAGFSLSSSARVCSRGNRE